MDPMLLIVTAGVGLFLLGLALLVVTVVGALRTRA